MISLAPRGRPFEILLVEDNPADADLAREGFAEIESPCQLHVVRDGDQAMLFLRRQPPFASSPRPDLVLLDLNLPGRDGRSVLAEIKGTASIQEIPVLILSTSQNQRDVVDCYRLQANCYIPKPMNYERFLEVVQAIQLFWFSVALLPENNA
jgi:CheY-like chemotaxis protein